MLLIILLTISAVSCLPVRESLCQRDDEFACNNGTCISAEWICDNVPDCLTGEDETNCHYLHVCPENHYMCRTGECLSTEVKCDGHFNCSDGSDEHGCKQIASVLLPSTSPAPPSPSLCHAENEFACNNGTCISAEWICDNVPDCLTGEDEANCHYLHSCPKDLFMCRTGDCLSKEVKCDGHFDCSDGSDEHGCKQIASVLLPSTSPASPSSLCHPDNEFACNNGTCISAEWICDNVPDCLTGEDEANCYYLHNCPKDLFMCRTGDCLSKEVKCDGHFDCFDGSDEHGCKQIASVLLPLPSSENAFWIYIVLMVLSLILLGLAGYGLYYFINTRRHPADDTKVQFLVVEDDGRCTAY